MRGDVGRDRPNEAPVGGRQMFASWRMHRASRAKLPLILINQIRMSQLAPLPSGFGRRFNRSVMPTMRLIAYVALSAPGSPPANKSGMSPEVSAPVSSQPQGSPYLAHIRRSICSVPRLSQPSLSKSRFSNGYQPSPQPSRRSHLVSFDSGHSEIVTDVITCPICVGSTENEPWATNT